MTTETMTLAELEAALDEHGSHRAAAEALGISKNAFTKRLIRAREAQKSGANAGLLSEAYVDVERAYHHFNRELFDDTLPPVMLIFARTGKSFGHYWSKKWTPRNGLSTEDAVDEISLNPSKFAERTDKEILSTLVHEMVHHKQMRFGEKAPKTSTHNAEWAQMMKDVGLYPSSTGQPGGKETGKTCSHYIVDGDLFDLACDKLIADGWALRYVEAPEIKVLRKKKRASKTAYHCPDCAAKVWGKPEMRIVCGDCDVPMVAEVTEETEAEAA